MTVLVFPQPLTPNNDSRGDMPNIFEILLVALVSSSFDSILARLIVAPSSGTETWKRFNLPAAMSSN
ncbi:hypothetical protein BCR41DRAFT_359559 [Lobosporangium transversale]|uniref:Uncharacterized protein n=1 Tax=Lobosporangium transversale TaxID=64571 RepID=A0A1Y2GE15_9FUNG|nr:hypothetical protein BCR41DRAFT_359559 [Lobosporangium transversale]ORZ08253.1 hypothetical protein BCR41DRAFT_359559 [Lobosporangium transversale]|eukprot:XP_021878336.1 hypothetical protein BCR41DRAFT_359559 [Lobosporangium transversale]